MEKMNEATRAKVKEARNNMTEERKAYWASRRLAWKEVIEKNKK